MNQLNVFNNPYYKWYYPQYWHKNIRMFFRSIKYAYQRITKGYADCDTFNLDNYYLNIFTGTLNHLADNHWGYPGNDEFPDDESKYETELIKEMVKMCENNNFNIFYTRIIQISDDLEQYDVGSWSEFFYISKTPMTERSID